MTLEQAAKELLDMIDAVGSEAQDDRVFAQFEFDNLREALTHVRQWQRETASQIRDVRVGVAYSAEYVRGELDRIANALERT